MKTMKRLGCLLLVLAMCLALGVTAMCAPQALSSSTDTTFSITVTDAADGETYNAYKIFDVTYSDPGSDGTVNYSYTIDYQSPWYPTVSAATDVFTLTRVNDSSTYIVTVNEGVEDDAVVAVFTGAGVPNGAESAASATASSGSAFLNVTSSGAGYYFVTTSLGSLVMIDTTHPTQEIEEKNGQPTIIKYVHENTTEEGEWGNEDDDYNGQTILFEIEVHDIAGAKNLVIHDAMGEGLEIPDEADFHMESVTLYTSKDAKGISLTEIVEEDAQYYGDYYITTGRCTVARSSLNEDCSFEIHFERDFSDVDNTGYIEITYKLLLDTSDDIYEDDVEGIENDAQVTFGTTSSSEIAETETYSFGFEVFKYTGSNEALEGVEFELTSSNNEKAYFLKETVDKKTIYLFEGWGEPASGSNYTTTLVSGSDGMIYVEGLDTGTYTLTETKALDGYNPLTGPITVTITATYNEAGALTNHTVTYTYDGASGTGVVNVENNTGSILPGTGGIGTTIFYVVGAVLVCGAAVVLISRKRINGKAEG